MNDPEKALFKNANYLSKFFKATLLLLFQIFLVIEIIVNFFIYIFFSWTNVRDIYGKCIIIKYISCDNEHEILPE